MMHAKVELKVAYDLHNGMTPDRAFGRIREILCNAMDHLANEGLLSDDSNYFVVDTWDYNVDVTNDAGYAAHDKNRVGE